MIEFKKAVPTPEEEKQVEKPVVQENVQVQKSEVENITAEKAEDKNLEIHIGQEESAKKESKNNDEDLSFTEKINASLIKLTPIKTKELATFFRLMATMQNAGITLLKSLQIMKNQTTNKRFADILEECADEISEGKNFSDCLKKYPNVFNEATTGMIASGESSGRLNQVLINVADEMEKSQKLSGKIKGAMIYPASVTILMFAVGVIVMTMVVPKFKAMFAQLGGELPAATKILMGISDFFSNNYIAIILAPFVIWFAVHQFRKTEYGRYKWDHMMLRLPVFGMLNRKVALSRFTSSLAALSEAGIDISKALQINADSIGNAVYQKRIMEIREDVEQGVLIAENIKNDTFLFPDMVVSMIDVGEQTATISKVARKISEFYDAEVDETVKGLTTAMEPIIIVVLGCFVGLFVAAIMQPIFMISDLIQNA